MQLDWGDLGKRVSRPTFLKREGTTWIYVFRIFRIFQFLRFSLLLAPNPIRGQAPVNQPGIQALEGFGDLRWYCEIQVDSGLRGVLVEAVRSERGAERGAQAQVDCDGSVVLRN